MGFARNWLALGGVVVLATVLPGCGGGGPTTPTATASTPPVAAAPCTQTLLFQDSSSVPTGSIARVGGPIPVPGRLAVVLDWTFPSSVLGLYLVAANTCDADRFVARTCNFLFASEVGPKPRTASAVVTPGNYEIWVANFSSVDEAVSVQVFLRSESCPAAAAPSSEAVPRQTDWRVLSVFKP